VFRTRDVSITLDHTRTRPFLLVVTWLAIKADGSVAHSTKSSHLRDPLIVVGSARGQFRFSRSNKRTNLVPPLITTTTHVMVAAMVGRQRRQYRRLNFFLVLLFSYFALSVAVKCEWEELGASGDYTTASDKVGLAGLTLSQCMTACAESTTCAVIHFCDVLSGPRYGECHMSSTVSGSPSAAGCSQMKNFKPKHGLTSCASCDASDPPKNGFIGNCTNSLARGSSCQPTCSSGFQASGSSFCSSSGILSSAVCTEMIDVSGRQMRKDSEGWILLLAYKHVGGGNVALVPGTVPTSPTEGYSHVWLDDIGLSTDNVNAVKFFCTSSVHSRVLHFSMNSAWIKSAISDGSASGNIAAQWTSGVTEFVGHSASLPGTTNAVFTEDLMKFPFYYNDSQFSIVWNKGIRAPLCM
jgi:hypothetical protein